MKSKILRFREIEENEKYNIVEENYETGEVVKIGSVEVYGSSICLMVEGFETYYNASKDDDIASELESHFMELLETHYNDASYFRYVDASELKELQSMLVILIYGEIGSQEEFERHAGEYNSGGSL